jgi:hypothetical protein
MLKFINILSYSKQQDGSGIIVVFGVLLKITMREYLIIFLKCCTEMMKLSKDLKRCNNKFYDYDDALNCEHDKEGER